MPGVVFDHNRRSESPAGQEHGVVIRTGPLESGSPEFILVLLLLSGVSLKTPLDFSMPLFPHW